MYIIFIFQGFDLDNDASKKTKIQVDGYRLVLKLIYFVILIRIVIMKTKILNDVFYFYLF